MRRETRVVAGCALVALLIYGSTTALADRGGGGKPKPPEPPADPAIAFVDDEMHRTHDHGWGYGLSVMNADGTNRTLIVDEKPLLLSDWSPNSGSLAFGLHGQLWAIDLVMVGGEPQGESLRQMTTGDETGPMMNWGGRPAWSPTGDLIATVKLQRFYDYVQLLEWNECSLWLVDVAPTGGVYGYQELYRLGDDLVHERDQEIWSPVWSQDGSEIAFIRTELSVGATVGPFLSIDILTLAFDAAGQAQITGHRQVVPQGPQGAFPTINGIDWANRPENANLMAFSTGDFNSEIYILDLDTTQTTFLTTGGGCSWSEDDSKIVFEVYEFSGGRTPRWTGTTITTIDIATRALEALGSGRTPDWRPPPPEPE